MKKKYEFKNISFLFRRFFLQRLSLCMYHSTFKNLKFWNSPNSHQLKCQKAFENLKFGIFEVFKVYYKFITYSNNNNKNRKESLNISE